jgi:hypothetical protein
MKTSLPDDWSALVDGYLLGTIRNEDAVRLEQILAGNAVARSDFMRRSNLESALRSAAASFAAEPEPIPSAVRKEKIVWKAPLRWAAAILLLGALGSPLAWALTTAKLVATTSRVSSMMDGGFEKTIGLLPPGFPTRFGTWSGDPSETAAGPNAPRSEGTRALRLISGFSEGSAVPVAARSCDVFQLVDLRPLRSALSSGESFLELSADFLDGRTEASPEIHFLCKICLFSGDPAQIQADWPTSLAQSLASSAEFLFTRGQNPGWRRLKTKTLLTKNADFALIHLAAGCQPDRRKGPLELGRQFIDNVSLTLRSQPILPVRQIPP